MTTITKLHLNWSDYDIGSEQNVKVFTLSDTSDLVNAQAAVDWYVNGWTPIIELSGFEYQLTGIYSTQLSFTQVRVATWAVSNQNWAGFARVAINISSNTVSSITTYENFIKISSTAPTSWDNSTITLVI